MPLTQDNGGITAIRGAALTYIDDPFRKPVEDCVVYESDALIVMQSGKISQFGPARDLISGLPEDTEITTYENSLILPGFIDCHVHYPQTEIIGAYGAKLIDWLNKYTFPAEQKFNSLQIPPYENFNYTFNKTGTYYFNDAIFTFMKGTIRVD